MSLSDSMGKGRLEDRPSSSYSRILCRRSKNGMSLECVRELERESCTGSGSVQQDMELLVGTPCGPPWIG